MGRNPLLAQVTASPIACCVPAGIAAACLALSLSATAAGAVEGEAVDLAYRFLETVMDRDADKVVVYTEPEWSQFFPAATGDIAAVTLDAGATGNPHGGRSSFAMRVDPAAVGRAGWSGVNFLYPENNWGAAAGRDLTGATRLSFWARADRKLGVKFQSGGINRDHAAGPHADSFGPIGGREVVLDGEWRRYDIDLAGQDLRSVLGAFAVVTRWDKNAPAYTIELDDAVIERPGQDAPRLLQSYSPSPCLQDEAPNSAHVYDQALVMLAFLARGRPSDLARAGTLADALVQAQSRDRTFHDGRLRNAYASGELIDPARGTARLPGTWDARKHEFHEDSYAVGSHTGNMAWAALALVQAHALLPPRDGAPYRRAAERLARWIVAHTKVDDPPERPLIPLSAGRRAPDSNGERADQRAPGGFSGGYEGFETAAGMPDGQEKLLYRSTEQNIDLVALFDLLGWPDEREHARRFVAAMRNDAGGPHLWTGSKEGLAEPNRAPVPLDVQTWSALAMGQPDVYRGVLDWALANCRAGTIDAAFDFDCRDGDGAWWEGTAHMATALRRLGRSDAAARVLAALERAQVREGPDQGAVPAASRCGLTTGFMRPWGPKNARETKPWLYSSAPHIGATAWFLFAALGRNPFLLAGPTIDPARANNSPAR